MDAGCGTGRVAIELARRGIDVVGVDLDADMVAAARRKAPELTWLVADLATMQLDRRFTLVAMAGNVLNFARPADHGLIVHTLAGHLEPGGLLVAGLLAGGRWPHGRWLRRAVRAERAGAPGPVVDLGPAALHAGGRLPRDRPPPPRGLDAGRTLAAQSGAQPYGVQCGS